MSKSAVANLLMKYCCTSAIFCSILFLIFCVPKSPPTRWPGEVVALVIINYEKKNSLKKGGA